MPAGTLISIEEYLSTSYEPECDYVDGSLQDRNSGEYDHGRLQAAVAVQTRPPYLCVEIVSPEDRMTAMQQRIDDYLAMGVRYVWLLDPSTRRACVATAETGLREVREAALRTENPALELPLAEVLE